MLWHEQSWPTIGAVDKNRPVVIPVGACEQHGRHLPLLVDTIQVTAIAERVEQRLKDRVILAPTLWLGSSHHHKDFPGTITLRPALYAEVITSIGESILRAGFRRIFFLNGHGGNETPLAQALAELVAQSDTADDAHLAFGSWWSVGREAIRPEKHGLTTPFVSHACEYETSMMLALRPDLVQWEAIVENQPQLQSPWFTFEYAGRVAAFRRYHRLTVSGCMGSPSKATAEKGQSLLEAVVGDVCDFLLDFSAWPDLPPIGPQ